MAEKGVPSIETLASGAIAAGCLQAVMSMVHPDLVKFVAVQKERVARTDAQRSPHHHSLKPEETENLSLEQQTDLSFQLKYVRNHWHSYLQLYDLDPELSCVVERALMYRNKVSHQSQMTLAQYEDAIATFKSLADIIECNALVRQQIRDLVTKLFSFSSLSKTQEIQMEPKEVKIQAKETKGNVLECNALNKTQETQIEPEEEVQIQMKETKKKKKKRKKTLQPSETKAYIPELFKSSDMLQELTSPKFHFAGAILDITKGKNSSTVFSLKTVIGQRWTLRVLPSSSRTNDAFDAVKAIAEAEVNNSMLVFWRSSPPLEMINRKALTVPMEGEVYGQDVAIYILKCSSQVLGVEVCQLRHNKYMENGASSSVCEIPPFADEELSTCGACKVTKYCIRECLRPLRHSKDMENGSFCSGCKTPPLPDEELSTCSACKAVKYCTRACQERHWKRIHRHMCKNTQLLEFCSTLSEDVTTEKQRQHSLHLALFSVVTAIVSLVVHVVYFLLLLTRRAIDQPSAS